MVSEKKKEMVKNLIGELKKYPVIGLLDMFKMPSKQLQEMREKLRGKATIKMVRKNVINLALEGVDKKGVKGLERRIENQPALLFSEMDPFELSRIIESSKSSALAKPGDVAPKDIVIPAGPTSLKPGPVIGELQRLKIPAGVEGEKIVVKKDTPVVKSGETIDKNTADVLAKLGVEPIEICLNLLAVWDHGIIYPKEILFIPLEKYENDVKGAYKNAFNLALNTGYLTKQTIPFLISKAYKEALSLSIHANLITKETVANLLAKAWSHMETIKSKLPKKEGETKKPEKELMKEEESPEEKPPKEGGTERGKPVEEPEEKPKEPENGGRNSRRKKKAEEPKEDVPKEREGGKKKSDVEEKKTNGG